MRHPRRPSEWYGVSDAIGLNGRKLIQRAPSHPDDDPRDTEWMAHPPRVLGPDGPIPLARPFLSLRDELRARAGWPGRSNLLADPPGMCGRRIPPHRRAE